MKASPTFARIAGGEIPSDHRLTMGDMRQYAPTLAGTQFHISAYRRVQRTGAAEN
jgi:hypothetical protein